MDGQKEPRPAGKKEFFLYIIVPTLFLLCAGLAWHFTHIPLKQADKEFNQGSNIRIDVLTDMQQENLIKLCKVWGFAKYYHPVLIDGERNWDYDLFRIMPQILEAGTAQEADTLLYNWLQELGTFEEGSPGNPGEVALAADTGWIADTSYLSGQLSEYLVRLSKTYITERKNAYASIDRYGYVNFGNEIIYPSMDYDDTGYRLLTLFRYWNIIEYYFPYKDLIGQDWNEVLAQFIPVFIESDEATSYTLATAQLVASIHDTHASFRTGNKTWENYWGYYAPMRFELIEDKLAVTRVFPELVSDRTILPGDVILRMDGRDIMDVAKERAQYISMADEARFPYPMASYLLRTQNPTFTLTLERDGGTFDAKITPLQKSMNLFGNTGKSSHEMLENNIGYIYPASLEKGEIGSIMEGFMDTDGLIIDLRCYPSDFIVYSLGAYLMPHPTPFVKMSFADPAKPGDFIYSPDFVTGKENPDYYKGKIAILMNGDTMSQAEFTVMAFRQAPNAVVIGSETVGADGNIISFPLSPDITTIITGLGTYYPDRSQTQRIGLKPDIYAAPTIKGLQEGRDEVLEKALEHIQQE